MLKLVSKFVLEVLPYVLSALIAAVVVPELSLFAALRTGSGGHANPGWWRDQPRRTGPT